MLIDRLINTVAQHFGISAQEMKSKTRKARIVRARHFVFYLARPFSLSLCEIAESLGRSDHATVIHGSKKIGRLATQNPQLRIELDQLRARALYGDSNLVLAWEIDL